MTVIIVVRRSIHVILNVHVILNLIQNLSFKTPALSTGRVTAGRTLSFCTLFLIFLFTISFMLHPGITHAQDMPEDTTIVPSAVSRPLAERQKLTASDGATEDFFGDSVSISGDRAIVGAERDRDSGFTSGSAYIFERGANGTWTEIQKLTASDGAADDWFGRSVSISGDSAIVGAYRDDDNGRNSGSAYIFERQANGTWTERQKLTASDGATDDRFGISVSISGDRAIVGAYFDDDNGDRSGSAYIFERQSDGTWTEIQKLTASDGAAYNYFGWSVSISGDRAIVGAIRDDDNGNDSGSAYIFERQADGSWTERQKLTASDGAADDYFGWSVPISGDRAIVGAYRDDDNGSSSGSAYIFERQSDGTWTEIQKLTASDGAAYDYFGWSVSISGDRAIVGAQFDDDNGSSSGSAYIFERQANGTWTEIQKLTAGDGHTTDIFGSGVSISHNRAIVGARGDTNNGTRSGSAYIFEPSFGTLRVTKDGTGTISSLDGIDCGPDCDETFFGSATVTLESFADTGSDFTIWGSDCSGTGDTTTVIIDGDRTCSATFSDIDACVNNPCTDANASCTDLPSPAPDTEAGRTCACNPGFSGDGTACTDIDECSSSETNNCDPNASCTNSTGSFSCECNTGFNGDGTSCAPDPCAASPCANSGVCTAEGTGFTCDCTNTGFSGELCADDIDECDLGTDNCEPNEQCTNTQGSFTCTGTGPGIAYIIDSLSGTNSNGALFRVEIGTGKRTIISDFGDITQGDVGFGPIDLAVATDGTVFVVEPFSSRSRFRGSLYRVDPTIIGSVNRTIISDFGNSDQGALGLNPSGVAIEGSGNILVIDSDAGTNNLGALFRVNRANGERTIISDFGDGDQGALGLNPSGVAIDGSGNIFVIDGQAGSSRMGALFKVDPTIIGSVNRTVLSDFGDFSKGNRGEDPEGVAIDGSGNVFVIDSFMGCAADFMDSLDVGNGRLFRLDPVSGQRTTVSSFSDRDMGEIGQSPRAVALLAATPPLFTLTVNKEGTGTGTVSAGDAIDCGLDCDETLISSTTVTLEAFADTGSVFTGWSGECTGTMFSTAVTVDSDTSCTATFNIQ